MRVNASRLTLNFYVCSLIGDGFYFILFSRVKFFNELPSFDPDPDRLFSYNQLSNGILSYIYILLGTFGENYKLQLKRYALIYIKKKKIVKKFNDKVS